VKGRPGRSMPRYYFNKGVGDDIAPGEEGMESRTREAVQRLPRIAGPFVGHLTDKMNQECLISDRRVYLRGTPWLNSASASNTRQPLKSG
jgi:hypothetical protein